MNCLIGNACRQMMKKGRSALADYVQQSQETLKTKCAPLLYAVRDAGDCEPEKYRDSDDKTYLMVRLLMHSGNRPAMLAGRANANRPWAAVISKS